MSLDPIRLTLASKAAADNGWEQPPRAEGIAIVFGSARFNAQASISADGDAGFMVVFSDSRVTRELQRSGWLTANSSVRVGDASSLDRLMRRGAEVALSLPDAPLHEYQQLAAAATIGSTEVERIAKQRIGQQVYRKALLALWEGRCAVTGLAAPDLLRASHARPWAQCESDLQRLDPFNGLLLTPNLDALFDGGWIAFADDGTMLVSPSLQMPAKAAMLREVPDRVRWVATEHAPYLAFHRESVFRHG